MPTIEYPPGHALELRVKDTKQLDEFDVFVNQMLVSHVASGDLQSFPINPPAASMAVAVHFQGTDGGTTAIVDVTNPANPEILSTQIGLIHSYLLEV